MTAAHDLIYAHLIMQRFYWLVEGTLAGCSRPGGRAGTSWDIEEDLVHLQAEGIEAVLSLTETPLPEDLLFRLGLHALHLPVPDMTAPTPGELLQALYFIDEHQRAGRAVAVHCLMGQGRTGTVLAAFLIREGMPAAEAIAAVRSSCSGAIESEQQVRALRAFAADRPWIV